MLLTFFFLFASAQYLTEKNNNLDLRQFNGEDEITQNLLIALNMSKGYYVEFYAARCNTRILRDTWRGVLFDLAAYDLNINLWRESITASNINEIFNDYDVPEDFDLLTVSTQYNEFYLWRALMRRPKIVLINYNSALSDDKVVVHDPHAYWDGSEYFGASILALYNLGRSKGYSLVYAEDETLFFVRDDLTQSVQFKNINSVTELSKGINIQYRRKDPQKRKYVSWSN